MRQATDNGVGYVRHRLECVEAPTGVQLAGSGIVLLVPQKSKRGRARQESWRLSRQIQAIKRHVPRGQLLREDGGW